MIDRLTLSDQKAHACENELKSIIDRCSTSADDTVRAAALSDLERLLGSEWIHVQEEVRNLIKQVDHRRKDYIYQIIENGLVTSFGQLKAESELSEPDLDPILEELEKQDKRIRRVSGGFGTGSQVLFKVQDLRNPESLRALLAEFKTAASSKKKHPELVWRLVELCRKLLIDDGFDSIRNEVDDYRQYFEGTSTSSVENTHEDSDESSALIITMNGHEIRASTARSLLEQVLERIESQKIDVSRAVPFLIGRTRYLLNTQPTHANGTDFAMPVRLGDLFFEGNVTRAQALNETIRFLSKVGVQAMSPNVEVEHGDDIENEGVPEEAEQEEAGDQLLGLVVHDNGKSVTISGMTVRRFFTSLLTHLIAQGHDLSKVTPVSIGRVRYLLAEEPYHANGRRFQAVVSKNGYYMEAAYPHGIAVAGALGLCQQLGLTVTMMDSGSESWLAPRDAEDRVPLCVKIGSHVVEGSDVPEFFVAAVEALYREGILTEEDIPYRCGRVRYFVSTTPTHVHGREFLRPIEVRLGGRYYFIEANISRSGALDLVRRLLAAKGALMSGDRSG